MRMREIGLARSFAPSRHPPSRFPHLEALITTKPVPVPPAPPYPDKRGPTTNP